MYSEKNNVILFTIHVYNCLIHCNICQFYSPCFCDYPVPDNTGKSQQADVKLKKRVKPTPFAHTPKSKGKIVGTLTTNSKYLDKTMRLAF